MQFYNSENFTHRFNLTNFLSILNIFALVTLFDIRKNSPEQNFQIFDYKLETKFMSIFHQTLSLEFEHLLKIMRARSLIGSSSLLALERHPEGISIKNRFSIKIRFSTYLERIPISLLIASILFQWFCNLINISSVLFSKRFNCIIES